MARVLKKFKSIDDVLRIFASAAADNGGWESLIDVEAQAKILGEKKPHAKNHWRPGGKDGNYLRLCDLPWKDVCGDDAEEAKIPVVVLMLAVIAAVRERDA